MPQVKIIKALPEWKINRMLEMHEGGANLGTIAGELGVRRERITAALKERGLEPNIVSQPKRQHRPHRKDRSNLAGDPAPRGPLDENYAKTAETELGKRLTYKRGMRLLDGSPCTFDEMMKAANDQRRKMAGTFIPLGKKPEWH